MNICIAGASRGLGRDLSRHFAQDGHSVWGIARSEEELKETEKECGKRFRWTVADLLDRQSLLHWKQAMEAVSFFPDVLILNASVQLDDMQDGYDHELGTTVLRTNLEGSLSCLSLFLGDFLKRRQGRMVAIASTAALRPSSCSMSYSASKAGLVMALRSLALQYGTSGVTFGTVMLGPIQTAMWEGKKSLLVPSSSHAAAAIARFAYTNKAVLYYPALSTRLLRLSRFLSDRTFAHLSRTFLK